MVLLDGAIGGSALRWTEGLLKKWSQWELVGPCGSAKVAYHSCLVDSAPISRKGAKEDLVWLARCSGW